MISIDQFDQRLNDRRMTPPSSRLSVRDSGARLLLLAVGGFLLIRLVVALLQLG